MDFQVWSFFFFVVDHMLILLDLIRSLTNMSKSFWPMSLCPTKPFWTFSGTTTFVRRLKSLLLSWVKGFVKLKAFQCSSLREKAGRPSRYDSICRLCPSHLFRFFYKACEFRSDKEKLCADVWITLILTRPPETLMDRFICSMAWSALNAQNATSWFLLTTQLPSRKTC